MGSRFVIPPPLLSINQRESKPRILVLHELLAFVDALRVGRMREKNLAIEELRRRLM